MKINTIQLVNVVDIPKELEEWKIYLSEKYGLSKHKCFCGCGESVVLPLERWSHYIDFMDGKLTISPSIGSFSLSCQSHYFIKNNTVEWC